MTKECENVQEEHNEIVTNNKKAISVSRVSVERFFFLFHASTKP